MKNQSTEKRTKVSGSSSLNQVKFTWTINVAKNIFELKPGKSIHSPSIIDGENFRWVIKFYPNGVTKKYENRMSITLGLLGSK